MDTLKHIFNNPQTDDIGAHDHTLPSDWNDEHIFSGGTSDGDVLTWKPSESDKAAFRTIVGGTGITVTVGASTITIANSATQVDGTGTAGFISKWVDANTLTDSIISESAGVLSVTGRYNGTVSISGADGVHSFQTVAGDMNLSGSAGSSTGTNPKFQAGMMGNILGDSLTGTANYLGGVIGHYSITGTKATTYPSGAVLAGISDGVTQVDGAVVAYIDGDSAVTTAGAAFKVRKNNSVVGSDFDFGLDLFDTAHDGYSAPGYAKAEIRLLGEACLFTGSGVPTDGVSGTGAGVAGKGSLFIDITNGEAYINIGTKASPTWKQITHA